MARISEIKVTLKNKTIFDKNEQTLEATIHLDDDYTFMSIKTERWDMLDRVPFDKLTDRIMDAMMKAHHSLEGQI